jgi:hypothetical protein
MANLEQELAKLKEEIRAMNRQSELITPPAANVAVPPAPKRAVPARKSPNRPPPDVTSPPPKPVPVKVSPPAPPKPAKQFPPSVKKGKIQVEEGWGWRGPTRTRELEIDVPDGIIAHLTRECGGNVHDRHVVEVTSGSFEKETYGANPHSGPYDNLPRNAAKNAAGLETDSYFLSACRDKKKDTPHTRNNWICYDFKERRVVPTHYAIRTNCFGPGEAHHLKSWLVETSADGESWQEVAREEENDQLNGSHFAGTFAVAGGGECRFIRLVNIGRNHYGTDGLFISAWEIFGQPHRVNARFLRFL